MMEPIELGPADSSQESSPQLPGDAPTNGEVTRVLPRTDKTEVVGLGARMEVSPIFEAAVRRAVESSKRPLPEEMSIGQAAEFLDVSREYLIKRLKRGELPYRLVGKRRRIPSAALVEENEKMFQRARKAAAEMTRISQELGLYDSDPPPAPTQ